MLIDWILLPIIKPVMDFFSTKLFVQAFLNVFYFEKNMGLSDTVVKNFNSIIFGFASLLLTVKLSYKLLSIYIFKTDGDASINPLEYVKSYIKGIIVTVCFTVFYNWLYQVVSDLGQNLLSTIGEQEFDLGSIIISGGSLTIFFIIYLIFVCILYVHFLMNGVRMFVLRVSIPFACSGLIDNDNGVFTVFIKKIFQTAAIILVQMLLVQISILPMKMSASFISIMASIAILAYSLKVTNDLTEIFAGSAGSGIGSKASSLSRGAGSLFKYFRK